ncbi:MAG: imidazole glycerol phosphate synthase subunit HisH [Candidatus Tectomicrobia bacterium]|uniref:Imidazole glycerol phosphate synthase subunit HisH n=1 Tax=Tectimicrobiota bacterium TaxID=2528274 RepID=A0A932GP01_UNCTE|nr:imidazole glycerol phosphate synthase subunit HisH [Candidatus Tectomicrobia bacterium]
MITIVDYGIGNLRSVQKAFERVGVPALLSSKPQEIEQAQKIVLPGVGAFRACMEGLRRYEMVDPLLCFLGTGRPFLGVCVGMQLLFSQCEEFGLCAGLGIFPGKVVRFPSFESSAGDRLKVPHMGWNEIEILRPAPVLAGLSSGARVYFVHSYYPVPEDPEVVATRTWYGLPFASSVWRGHIFGTQFHPEKSQRVGLEILRRFGDL